MDSEKVDPNPIFSSKLDFDANSKLESEKKQIDNEKKDFLLSIKI